MRYLLAIMYLYNVCLASGDVHVLTAVGTVYLKTSKGTTELKGGDVVPRSSQIIVTTSSNITFITKNGEYAALTRVGTHKLSKVLSNSKRGSTSERIARYLWSALQEDERHTTAGGAVYRAQRIALVWPPNTAVDTHIVALRWYALEGKNLSYRVVLADVSGKRLQDTVVKDTSFICNFGMLASPARGSCIRWNIEVESDPAITSEARCVVWSTDSEIEKMRNNAKKLVQEAMLNNASPQVIPLLLGGYYEEAGYYDRAIEQYQQCDGGYVSRPCRKLYDRCVAAGYR